MIRLFKHDRPIAVLLLAWVDFCLLIPARNLEDNLKCETKLQAVPRFIDLAAEDSR